MNKFSQCEYVSSIVFLFILMLFGTAPNSKAQNSQKKGNLTGKVTDASNHEPITGASVSLVNTDYRSSSDENGNFVIKNISTGVYTVKIQYLGYKDIFLKDIKITETSGVSLKIGMVENGQNLQTVEVVASLRKNTELSMLNATKNSLSVQSAISAQQISRTQDKDASEVIKRVPGISILENKFVMVRGLSERYNNVWINGAGVPSSESDKRAFSFDLIPSSQIDNMIVIKSQSPDLPADFSGGFIKINTKEIPDMNSFSISMGTGVNDKTNFRTYKYNPGSNTDFLGFDNGKRDLSGGMNTRMDNNDEQAVNEMTKNGFDNDWSVKKRKPLPDIRFNSAWNHNYNLGNNRKIAIISALNYTNSYSTIIGMNNARYSIWNTKTDEADPNYNYSDNVYSDNVRLGAMANITFVSGEHSKYEFKNIFNQLGINRYTERNGYQYESQKYIQQKDEYFYSSRMTYSGQLTGKYSWDHAKLDWNTGYAYANKNQPDRRIINRTENTYSGDLNEGKMFVDQNDITRESTKLGENIYSGSVNFSKDINIRDLRPTLKAGGYIEHRNRTYKTRDFFYLWNDDADLPDNFNYENVISKILIPENYGTNKIYVHEETDNRNNYKGNNNLYAGYLGLNIPVGDFNVYAGVRYEKNIMKLTSFTSISYDYTKTRNYTTNDLFPSVNATYKFDTKHQLRFAYGKSINRQEFREVSPSVYYDFDLFSDVAGNVSLKPAYINNFDLRYEIYPKPSETISLGIFYKHFKNPIEWNHYDTGGGQYTYTFENADQANNYGVEIDLKKDLGFIGMDHFSLLMNGSLIKSRVKFTDGRNADRAMQGQSPYLVNGGLFYNNDKFLLNAALLYNRIGKRIIATGKTSTSNGSNVNNDIPDSYEMPRNSIDFSISKKFGGQWEIKANARNILSENIVYKQFPEFIDSEGHLQKRQQTTRKFDPGRSFIISLIYTL